MLNIRVIKYTLLFTSFDFDVIFLTWKPYDCVFQYICQPFVWYRNALTVSGYVYTLSICFDEAWGDDPRCDSVWQGEAGHRHQTDERADGRTTGRAGE